MRPQLQLHWTERLRHLFIFSNHSRLLVVDEDGPVVDPCTPAPSWWL